ncbi:antitoxin YezG family protein [Variovorax soli]|jgi:hypothetical protein|uniref:antitoxin YezG family protein n=1 Tax=Variovorax soli TaxID=376815 RepID=UPI001C3F30B4|nr:antitoxin YezG family protein [Variovorax soli]
MTQTSYWRKFNGSEIENDRFPPLDVATSGSRALLFLRKDLLKTTGEHIWGLTFTLYPDGKFNIEYDYNKPEGYEEEPPHQAFLDQCMEELREKTDAATAAWGLGREERWNIDLQAGILSFHFPQGQQVDVPIQVVGTYNQADGTFLWGWDHPSVPEPLRRAAQAVRVYGQEQSIEELDQREVRCSEDQAWEFAAVAAHLDNAVGAYRGATGKTLLFMTFGRPMDESSLG